jgi:chorismate mutase
MSRSSHAAELARLRGRIDAVDRRLLTLLVRRGELVQALAALKRSADVPMFDPAREADLVADLSACSHAPYTDAEIESIWRAMLAASLALMARDEHEAPRTEE